MLCLRSVTEWEKEREIEEFTRASILYRPMSTSISSRFTRGSLVEDSSVSDKKEETVIDEKSDNEKAAKLGLFGKLTRKIHDWYPSSLLCKRFNVPDPYPHSQFTGTVGRGRKTGASYLPYLETAMQSEQLAMVDDLPERIDVSDSIPGKKDILRGTENEEKYGQGVEKPIEQNLPTKANSFRNTPAVSGPLSYLNNDDVEQKEESAGNEKVLGADEVGDDNSRPSMDLFKAIFADTSDSSDSESDNEKEAVPIDDSKNEQMDSRNPSLTTVHASRDKTNRTVDDLDTENDCAVDMGINAVRHPSSETKTTLTDKEADTYSAANRLDRPDQPLSGIGAKGRDDESEKLTTCLMSGRDEERDNGKEKKGIENKGKKKKKEKKKKEKKKKKKKEKKMKKRRNVEQESSSEWSSNSEEDDVVQTNRDRKTDKLKIEQNTRESINKKHKSQPLSDRGSEWSTDIKRECTSKRDRYDKQWRISRETAKSGSYDEFSRGGSRSGNHHLAESSSGSLGISKQSAAKSSKTMDSSKFRESSEDVPSAAELYQRLKKHGVTLKRMSAADFM